MTIADVFYEDDGADWRDLVSAQAGSLVSVWDNLEDDVWDDA